MSFLKLGTISNIPSFVSTTQYIRFGEVVNGEFLGINYLHAHIDASPELHALVPADGLALARPTLMVINREVPPHIDNGISCVLNIYLETSNCITQFYSLSSNEKSFQIENQTNGRIFDPDCLEPTVSFVANPGDVYLLDVSQPHAVWPQGNGEVKRRALCYQTSVPFQQVARLLGKA